MGPEFDIAPLINLGAVGVICVFLLWFTRRVLDERNEDLKKQRDHAQRQLDLLNEDIREKYIPALISSTEAVKRSNDLSVELAALIRDRR
jgi:F0F1-type ATP synthase membrane subunit b/b'